ncbi:uncharacterized protein B4U79_12865 [Dinothrombium tinctorium]|uniref:Mitochondria-eating protein n=1 Tax=Dinothrombium tinctorium TaxID=1965070 RepID=A0A3S3PKV1_9ACAR|nr:uncharacterized protein B4U79_12865 [Dinothrombium tinctorium]
MNWRKSQLAKDFDSDNSDLELDIPRPMKTMDISSSLAIRRIMLLYDNLQLREASSFIGRLNHAAFRMIIRGLPIDKFIESMPTSLPILEALYSKVFVSSYEDTGLSLQMLRPFDVVMHLVRLFALQNVQFGGNEIGVNNFTFPFVHETFDNNHPAIIASKNLLKVIALSEPDLKKQLYARKKAIDRAIAGMGHHGLVGTSDDTLMNLHDALKIEFDRVIHNYKIAVQKLDELSLAASGKQPVTSSVSHGPAPTKASHQRQLSLRQEEIQERLIKNKTLLNAVEPCAFTHYSLQILLGILEQRIEFDKEVLFQFTQLRKEFASCDSSSHSLIEPSSVVAPVLMRFSYGFTKVLNLLTEIYSEFGNRFAEQQNEDESDISGYHSDSDSTILNAPLYVSPHKTPNRYNAVLYRSVRNKTKRAAHHNSSNESGNRNETERERSNSGGSTSVTTNEASYITSNDSSGSVSSSDTNSATGSSAILVKGSIWTQHVRDNTEIETLRRELVKAKQTIFEMQEKEQKLKDRLAEQAQRMLERGLRFENVCLGERRPTALIRKFGNLYAQARVDTLDALDSLHQLKDAEELKSKLLFSVVVLAFRSVQKTIADIKQQIAQLLQISDSGSNKMNKEAINELQISVNHYLKSSCDCFNTAKNVEEVCNQIYATLYDYPCLKSCDGLTMYVRDCVRIGWALTTQTPPFVIEYETRYFRRDMHIRFHTSNQDSDVIKTYLWPALLEEGANGACVHKGVVIT